MPSIAAPAGWKATLTAAGPDLMLNCECPTCRAPLAWTVTPGPWPVLQPAERVRAEKANGFDGHRDPDFSAFESDRAAGKLKHSAMPTMPFELFCQRCHTRADSTLTA